MPDRKPHWNLHMRPDNVGRRSAEQIEKLQRETVDYTDMLRERGQSWIRDQSAAVGLADRLEWMVEVCPSAGTETWKFRLNEREGWLKAFRIRPSFGTMEAWIPGLGWHDWPTKEADESSSTGHTITDFYKKKGVWRE